MFTNLRIEKLARRVCGVFATVIVALSLMPNGASAKTAQTEKRGNTTQTRWSKVRYVCSEAVRVEFRFPNPPTDVVSYTISLVIDEKLIAYQLQATGPTYIPARMAANRPVHMTYQVFALLSDGSSRLLGDRTSDIPATWNTYIWFSVFGDPGLQVGTWVDSHNC
jgi:hypothetical protein